MTRRRTATVGAALALALAVTGCSGDDGADGNDDYAALAQDYSVLGALAEIPASAVDPDSVLVQTADLRAATEADGVDFPSGGSREDVTEWLMRLTNDPKAPVFVPLAESFNTLAASPDEFADVAGWSLIDVDSFVEYSVQPETFAVVVGDFDDDTLSSDLVEIGDGVVSDREGEDNEVDPAQSGPLNRLGQPTRFAQQGDRIALGGSTPAVTAWLDGDESLADDQSFAAIATALDEENVLCAVLNSIASGSDPAAALGGQASPEQLKALREEFDSWLPKDSFDAVGIGWGVDDGQSQVHVAYHFGSSSAADSAGPVLEQAYREGKSSRAQFPWSDRMGVEDVDVDGSVVTVTVSPTEQGSISDLHQALVSRDSLFVSR